MKETDYSLKDVHIDYSNRNLMEWLDPYQGGRTWTVILKAKEKKTVREKRQDKLNSILFEMDN